MSILDNEARISELSAALGMAIGYLERMSQAKLRDPEGHRKMLDRLNGALVGAPKISLATAIIETAQAVCDQAAKIIEKKGDAATEEERKNDYQAIAKQVRSIFQPTEQRH